MSLLLSALALFLTSAHAQQTPAACPKGTDRTITNNPYQPFECVKEDVKKGFSSVTGGQGFKMPPKCPRGTRADASSDGLRQYRCVRVLAGETDPILTPITSDEDAPVKNDPAARSPRIPAIGSDAYRRYTVPAEMSFEYPSLLQPRDGWKEEVPTLSFTFDDGSPGKPVTITITKVEPSQPTFINIEAAQIKDKEWQGAADGGVVPVAGVQARVTFVAGQSKTAYVPLAANAYYAVVYSAPVESYEVYLGAFNRLLKTMRLTRRGK